MHVWQGEPIWSCEQCPDSTPRLLIANPNTKLSTTPGEGGRTESAHQKGKMVASHTGRCLETTTTTAGLRYGPYQNRVVHIKETEKIIPFSPPAAGGCLNARGKASQALRSYR